MDGLEGVQEEFEFNSLAESVNVSLMVMLLKWNGNDSVRSRMTPRLST